MALIERGVGKAFEAQAWVKKKAKKVLDFEIAESETRGSVTQKSI